MIRLKGHMLPTGSKGYTSCHSNTARTTYFNTFHISCSLKPTFFNLRLPISRSNVNTKGSQYIYIEEQSYTFTLQFRTMKIFLRTTSIICNILWGNNFDRHEELFFIEKRINQFSPNKKRLLHLDLSRQQLLLFIELVLHKSGMTSLIEVLEVGLAVVCVAHLNSQNYLQNCPYCLDRARDAIWSHIIKMEISSDSSSSSANSAEFRRIYMKQLAKQQPTANHNTKMESRRKRSCSPPAHPPSRVRRSHSRSRSRDRRPGNKRTRSPEEQQGDEVLQTPKEIPWFIYPRSNLIDMRGRIPNPQILKLPIYRKQQEILQAIMENQFVLVTGQTGCGKSTQVPRLIYQYLRETGQQGKIMCVQPRRLAVRNLHSIMEKQMQEKRMIGYQIGQKSFISSQNRIVFVTNGIFLQRLVHSTDFFAEYPFIILDQVHQRDIDTDFILLAIKRLIRQHPRIRIVLMSATIDNDLFKYYFASDHIDNLLKEENFYKKIIKAQEQARKAKLQHRLDDEEEEEDDMEINSDNEEQYYKNYSLDFMKAKYPCPAINVTQPGRFKRTFFYLDTVHKFLKEGTVHNRWGSIIFSDKYPSAHKELFQTAFLIVDQVAHLQRNQRNKGSILVFVPGLAQIQGLSQYISRCIPSQRLHRQFQLIHVHSTILNDETHEKLHESFSKRIKIIISTNIAQSSITVMGVKYVIDFCLSKEVRFDIRSRMENLELVWASKASCNQRAGRTGRVCDGIIFRLLEESFYMKLPDYSTPEIQRSSLDKIVLRIKLLHQGGSQVFADPGEVLGSAIQPPNLKNIDTAIKSLQFCGGLELRGEQFFMTELGRFYIDIPIDITFCKLLVVSLLLGTFNDIIVLVAILSQSKNAVRKGNIDRNYVSYYHAIDNPHTCDFLALIQLYKATKKAKEDEKDNYSKGYNNNRGSNSNRGNNQNRGDNSPKLDIGLETISEVQETIKDIKKRMEKKEAFKELMAEACRTEKRSINDPTYLFYFKLTLLCGFIENVLKVREPTYDEKQQKRLKFMKREGISIRNTVCLLSSNVIRKPQNEEQEEKLKRIWQQHVQRALKVKNTDFTITHGLSYLHFQTQRDLQKFLFYRYIQENKKSFSQLDFSADKNYLSPAQVFKCFGEMDHMHQGRPVTFCKEQTVAIDNYSLNRVVNVNEGDPQKFLIASTIAKQSSRMVARYTSLLPHDVPYLEVIGHLLFYPFVQLVPNKSKTRYEAIQLKNKHRVPLPYCLTPHEIDLANVIRSTLRAHLSLEGHAVATEGEFARLVEEFVRLQRQEVIEEERWQQTYLQEVFQKDPQLHAQYVELTTNREVPEPMQDYHHRSQKIFMNDIKPIELTVNFFSNIRIGDTTMQSRREGYNRWKRQKLREITQIQRKAIDHDSYLACGQDSCGLRLAKLKKVGPITQEIFRELYQIEQSNIQEAAFNEYSHFCSLLMTNCIDNEYKIFSCTNNHYFGIMFDRERRIRIMPFSQLLIIYPDGIAEKARFQTMEYRYWRSKHEEHLKLKFERKLATYCFVCDQLMGSFKDLEYHIREGRHNKHVREFKSTLPPDAPKPVPMEIEHSNDQQEGY